ncbi:MAG TPA: response regulator [Pyrinomonadaceae bacterium]|nr:response regulator [Pyrinomonadaceae bacterium]
MESAQLQSFLEKAEDRLAGIRGSLLLFAQGRLTAADLVHGHRKLSELKDEASKLGLVNAAYLAAECATAVEMLVAIDGADLDASANKTLDLISRLEAEMMQMPLGSEDFIEDVNELVDASFEQFKAVLQDDADTWENEDFEIDHETIEIFRSEAEGLLANINTNLRILRSSPDDSNAIWEIRRNAHTFKGAAGIIGFAEASQLAHRIEDLLDKMVELRCSADARLIDLLTVSTTRLDEMTSGKDTNDDPKSAARLSKDFDRLIDSISSAPSDKTSAVAAKQPIKMLPVGSDNSIPVSTPVVRVSLDRLDDLLKISRGLLVNRSALAERFAEVQNSGSIASEIDSLKQLESLLEIQQKLSDEMLHRLMQIRMVRFGNLEMRLNRAVQVTGQEENKKAHLEIQNGDLEVDTLVIDALVEPLLHLLKNAVVHGIEPPETRRLLGKPEKGRICVTVSMDADDLILSVEDDGRGISAAKLIEKAIAAGIIDEKTALSLDEFSAHSLVFEKGLTTAESLNLNAGRGIGMSIVKESVEARGGSMTVESEQQQGTKFTMRMPVTLHPVPAPDPEPEPIVEIPPLVLVVDDSASIRRMTAKIVEDAGLRAITAASGADALELLLNGEWEPDLILSDVEMPVMDGWELLEYVKTDDNFGHIPVVMVTSLDAPQFKQKAYGLGASDYLVKPFSSAELERVCGSLLKTVAV